MDLRKIQIIKLQYASAAEIVRIIEAMNKTTQGKAGTPTFLIPKIVADERKRNLVENLTKNEKKTEVRIVRIPYYFQLTNDVAKFLFEDLIV